MAGLAPNLGNYQAPSNIGSFALPSPAKNAYVASVASNPLSSLNLTGIGKPTSTGITNQNLLPAALRSVTSSNGATSPIPTKITPPSTTPPASSSGSSTTSPAAQTFINSQLTAAGSGTPASTSTTPNTPTNPTNSTGTPPPATPPTTGTPGTSTTGTSAAATATQPSTYDLAMKSYLSSLQNAQDLSASVQKQTLDANHQYQSDLDQGGGLLPGNQATAALDARRNNASLADLGVASTAATNAENLAYQQLQTERTNNAPYTLSPGDVRFDANGKQIAAVPANPSSIKTIGSPTEGVYEQQSDGSFKQVMAPVGGDNVQSLATELVTGNLAPADLSKRSTGVGSYSDILTAANQISQSLYGKPFDIAKANTDYKFANNPQTQNTLNYLGSLVGSTDGSTPGNLDQLVNLSGQVAEPKGLLGLGQSNFPALNDATQWARLSTGDPVVAAYYSTLLEVSDQVAKVLQGGGNGGTSDAKLAQAQSLFQKGFTKDQIAAVAGALKPLLANRATSMIKDNPYLSSYAQQFGITQNNNKGTTDASGGSGSTVQTAIGPINTDW